MAAHKYIGTDYPRPDGLEKATGRTLFVTDMTMPDMLRGMILRSPYGHARIRRIDASEAEKAPGVKAVLTGNDIKGRFHNYGAVIPDQPVVAIDRVRYAGDPVAAVAAVDLFAAEEALSLIRVEYDELPGVFTIEEAMSADAPLIHDAMPLPPALRLIFNPVEGTNVCNHFMLRHGDVERGFRESDIVFEDTFSTEPDQHAVLETHGCIARVFPGPRIEIITNNQDPSNLQAIIAHVFDVPQSGISYHPLRRWRLRVENRAQARAPHRGPGVEGRKTGEARAQPGRRIPHYLAACDQNPHKDGR